MEPRLRTMYSPYLLRGSIGEEWNTVGGRPWVAFLLRSVEGRGGLAGLRQRGLATRSGVGSPTGRITGAATSWPWEGATPGWRFTGRPLGACSTSDRGSLPPTACPTSRPGCRPRSSGCDRGRGRFRPDIAGRYSRRPRGQPRSASRGRPRRGPILDLAGVRDLETREGAVMTSG